MNFRNRWGKAQTKERQITQKKAISAQDSDVLKRPTRYNRSWSARMPAYYGTELCPVKSMRGGKCHE